MENQVNKEVIELVKKIVQDQIKSAKQECFALANPEGLEYEQLSASERVLYDFCYYLDGYDSEVLEKLVSIINRTFYG